MMSKSVKPVKPRKKRFIEVEKTKSTSNYRRTTKLLQREELTSVDFYAGERPYARGELKYLHSSIKGFNQDYDQLIQRVDLAEKFRRLCDRQLQQNAENIQLLRTVSRQYKKEKLGISADAPLETSPVLQGIYNHSGLVRELQRLQVLAAWKSINYGELGEKNRALKHDEAHRADFYQSLGKEFQDCLTNINNYINNSTTIADPLKELRDLVAHLLNTINVNATNHRELWNAPLPGSPLSSQLGTNWEHVLTELLAVNIENELHTEEARKQIIHVGQQGGLSDIVDQSFTIKLPNYGAKLMAGFSAKFRTNNNFDIKSKVILANVFEPFQNDIETLEAIGYVYNQFAALSTFSSEYYRFKNYDINRKHQDVTSQRAWLTRTNSEFGRIFIDLVRYINLYMINLGFFGNRIDAKNTPPFSQDFFDKMLNGDVAVRVPAFLLTMRHPYETADVFQSIQDQLEDKPFWTVKDLFAGGYNKNGRFTPNAAAFRTAIGEEGQLRENYAKKARALREATATGKSFDIYDIVLSQPLMNAKEVNILKILGSRDETIRTHFSLMKYLHQ